MSVGKLNIKLVLVDENLMTDFIIYPLLCVYSLHNMDEMNACLREVMSYFRSCLTSENATRISIRFVHLRSIQKRYNLFHEIVRGSVVG